MAACGHQSRPTRRRRRPTCLNSAVRQRGDRAVFGVVFLMLFAFSYSEQLVSGLFPVVGGGGHDRMADHGGRRGRCGAGSGRADESASSPGPTATRHGYGFGGGRVSPFSSQSMYLRLIRTGVDSCRRADRDCLRRRDRVDDGRVAERRSISRCSAAARRVALPTDWARVRAIVPLVFGTWLCYLAASAFVDYFDVRAVRALDPATADKGR